MRKGNATLQLTRSETRVQHVNNQTHYFDFTHSLCLQITRVHFLAKNVLTRHAETPSSNMYKVIGETQANAVGTEGLFI